MEKFEAYKKKVKESFDKKVKKDTFLVGDAVPRWDAWNDEKGKHGKFDNLWLGPFTIVNILGNNTFILQNLDGDEVASPVNWRFFKHFHTNWIDETFTFTLYILQFLYIRIQPNKVVWFQFKGVWF